MVDLIRYKCTIFDKTCSLLNLQVYFFFFLGGGGGGTIFKTSAKHRKIEIEIEISH